MVDVPWTDEAGARDIAMAVLKLVERVGREDPDVVMPPPRDFADVHEDELDRIVEEYLREPTSSGEDSVLFNGDSHLSRYAEQLTEDEVEQALRYRARKKANPGGRPSKVDHWVERIEAGEATLEDARDEVSDPTWYRIKDRL